MSVKKQSPRLRKLHSFYEEMPEELLDENDVDGYFYHNFFVNFQSKQRKVRVSKGCNRESFTFKLFQFCNLNTQQRYILQEVNISKSDLSSLVDSLPDSLRNFGKASKRLKILLPKPQNGIGSANSEDNLFAQYYSDILEHPNIQIRLSFQFGKNNSCVFSIENFELHGNYFVLTETVNRNRREIHHLYRNRYKVANKSEIFECTYDVEISYPCLRV